LRACRDTDIRRDERRFGEDSPHSLDAFFEVADIGLDTCWLRLSAWWWEERRKVFYV
jgi:hypothetical protein